MKPWVRRGCALAFLVLCAAVLLFLQRFTRSEPAFAYPAWETGAVVSAGGAETAFDPAGLPPELGEGERYRYAMTLPEGRANGDFLIFETAGLEIAAFLDGTELWYSAAGQDPGTANLSQVQLPLPAGGGERLTVELRPLSGAAIVPPLLRLSADPTDQAGAVAYANYYGLPAGASALALVLLWGLFLLGLTQGRLEWALLLPVLAAVLLTVHRLAVGYGSLFLPQALQGLFTGQWPEGAAALLLALYLALHRERAFWRALGLAAGVSAGALALMALVSHLRGGYLAGYLPVLAGELLSGVWSGALYWLNWWLVLVCAGLSAWELARTLSGARAEARALALKNQLMLDNYRAIEDKLRQGAALRHEFSHRLAALDALYREGDMEGLGRALAAWRTQNAGAAQVRFTAHTAVNAILQDASARAEAGGVRFHADVSLPERLPIPHEDLCALLMNLLDNALEGAARTPAGRPAYLRFQARLRGGFLAVRCENSFDGRVEKDEAGRLCTTKPGRAGHGFGLAQMAAVAERYHSILDVSYTDAAFTVQTALKLPEAA